MNTVNLRGTNSKHRFKKGSLATKSSSPLPSLDCNIQDHFEHDHDQLRVNQHGLRSQQRPLEEHESESSYAKGQSTNKELQASVVHMQGIFRNSDDKIGNVVNENLIQKEANRAMKLTEHSRSKTMVGSNNAMHGLPFNSL